MKTLVDHELAKAIVIMHCGNDNVINAMTMS